MKNTGYMLHVWTVPGYESSLGVFSHLTPALKCADGTYYMKNLDNVGWTKNLCKGA